MLTEFGKSLKHRAETLFLMADKIISEFPTMGQYPKEKFNLGVLNTIPSNLVFMFSEFLFKDLLLDTTIIDLSRERRLVDLDNGTLDFVLSDEIEPQTDRYLSVHLCSSKLIAFSSVEFLTHSKNFPQNLHAQPYLSPFTRGQVQLEVEHYFRRHKIFPKQIGFIDNNSLMKLVVENKPCFGILPSCALKSELSSSSLRVVGEIDDIKFNLWGIFPRSSAKKENIENVISTFLQSKFIL